MRINKCARKEIRASDFVFRVFTFFFFLELSSFFVVRGKSQIRNGSRVECARAQRKRERSREARRMMLSTTTRGSFALASSKSVFTGGVRGGVKAFQKRRNLPSFSSVSSSRRESVVTAAAKKRGKKKKNSSSSSSEKNSSDNAGEYASDAAISSSSSSSSSSSTAEALPAIEGDPSGEFSSSSSSEEDGSVVGGEGELAGEEDEVAAVEIPRPKKKKGTKKSQMVSSSSSSSSFDIASVDPTLLGAGAGAIGLIAYFLWTKMQKRRAKSGGSAAGAG